MNNIFNKLLKKHKKQTYCKTAHIPRDISAKDMIAMLKLLGRSFEHLKNTSKWAVTGDRTESLIILTIQCEGDEESGN